MTMNVHKNEEWYIRWLLDNNPIAVERAILAIYRRQTASEQASDCTHESNGIGFSSFDAPIAGYWASWITGMKNGKRTGSGRHLTGKHLDQARRMMHKYVRQLSEIASENMERHAIIEESRIVADDSEYQFAIPD